MIKRFNICVISCMWSSQQWHSAMIVNILSRKFYVFEEINWRWCRHSTVPLSHIRSTVSDDVSPSREGGGAEPTRSFLIPSLDSHTEIANHQKTDLVFPHLHRRRRRHRDQQVLRRTRGRTMRGESAEEDLGVVERRHSEEAVGQCLPLDIPAPHCPDFRASNFDGSGSCRVGLCHHQHLFSS